MIDVPAAARVLASEVPITLVPLDAINDVPVPPSWGSRFETAEQTPSVEYLGGLVDRFPVVTGGFSYLWDEPAASVAAGEPIGRSSSPADVLAFWLDHALRGDANEAASVVAPDAPWVGFGASPDVFVEGAAPFEVSNVEVACTEVNTEVSCSAEWTDIWIEAIPELTRGSLTARTEVVDGRIKAFSGITYDADLVAAFNNQLSWLRAKSPTAYRQHVPPTPLLGPAASSWCPRSTPGSPAASIPSHRPRDRCRGFPWLWPAAISTRRRPLDGTRSNKSHSDESQGDARHAIPPRRQCHRPADDRLSSRRLSRSRDRATIGAGAG